LRTTSIIGATVSPGGRPAAEFLEAQSMASAPLPPGVPEAASPASAAAPSGRSAIEAVGVTKTYPARDGSEVNALDGLTLRVEPGEFVGIIGPSGCGKSTFLKMVAGLESTTAGTLARSGSPIRGPQPDVGFVFQAATLLPWLTVLENVMFPARVQKLPKGPARQRARELLASVGLADFEGQYPSELSGGMQQRVAITRALLHDPALLLMDEPFAALDALTRDRMSVELQSLLLRHRKPVLFVTHSIPEALFLSDRVLVMSGRPGRVLAEFSIADARPRTIDAAYADTAEIGARIRRLLSEEAR
jgi:NitT/TauT family transport system ATP-binding protein